MKLKLIPTSESHGLYAALVTIPCLGALAAIIMYDYFGANFLLADAVMYVSKIFGCYSTCAILYKIGTLAVLRRPKAAFLRVLTTVATLIGNIVLGLLYLGIQASRVG